MVLNSEKKANTIYITSDSGSTIVVVDVDEKSNIWHQRLGHLSKK